MKKVRVPISDESASEILFLSNRTCCVCTTPGKPVQLHHIDEDPSNNNVDNLAVLCLDCHNDTMIKGGFGRKLDAAQVTRFKIEWQDRVKERKEAADKIASIQTVIDLDPSEEYVDYKSKDDLHVLSKYLTNIQIIHRAQIVISKAKYASATNFDLKHRSYYMIDFYAEVLSELATFYPPNHFLPSPSKYFSEQISSKYAWYTNVSEPFGHGTGGREMMISIAASVMDDLKSMVSRMVFELIYQLNPEGLDVTWCDEWCKDEN